MYGLFLLLLLASCKNENQEWEYNNTIDLGPVTPIGMTIINSKIWISDGDNNQLVQLDKNGIMQSKKGGFERPMHIATDGKSLYVPEYGKDQITVITENEQTKLKLTDSLDAPAGIHFADNNFAIADFYNHRILFGNEDNWISFGKEGKADGEFYYPTDVHIANQEIYVADAYNNRVQVFDFKGNHLSTIGEEEKINAATGLYISDSQVFVTDFENDRVIVYSRDGELQQIISDGLEKPTDILMVNGQLWIANYKGKNIMKFQLK